MLYILDVLKTYQSKKKKLSKKTPTITKKLGFYNDEKGSVVFLYSVLRTWDNLPPILGIDNRPPYTKTPNEYKIMLSLLIAHFKTYIYELIIYMYSENNYCYINLFCFVFYWVYQSVKCFSKINVHVYTQQIKKIKENKSLIIKCYLDEFRNNLLIDSSVSQVPWLRIQSNNQFTTTLIDSSITQ
jgi:hypothetical protein